MEGLLLSEFGRDMGLYTHQTGLPQKGIDEPSFSWMSQRKAPGSTWAEPVRYSQKREQPMRGEDFRAPIAISS